MSDIARHKRVLSRGCYPFLSGRSGKPLGLPWQAFRPQRRASIASTNRSAFALSQSLTTPFADLFAGLKDRNLRDGEFYTENNFPGQFFVCFIFQRLIYFRFAQELCNFFGEINGLKLKQQDFLMHTRKVFYEGTFEIAARIADCTRSASSSLLYGYRGQKNPFKPSFRRRGTT